MDSEEELEANPDLLLEGRHVQLRPIRGADYEFLRQIELSPAAVGTWRFRGATPAPEQFPRLLQDGVLACFVVFLKDPPRPIGSVMAYNADLRNGHVHVAGIARTDDRGTGRLLEGLGVLIDYCFRLWTFRKVYAETFDFNISQFSSVTRWGFVEEARLTDHEYFDDRYWDKITLALTRSRWKSLRASLFEPIVASRTLPRAEQFYDELANTFGLRRDEVEPGSRLIADLGFDSMSYLVLGFLLEMYSGIVVPEGVLLNLVTVGDALDYVNVRSAPLH
jgi:RimJ/RimL family protein N-acetyltransferase/acyl carrier protein